jgi:hypothetical protein
MVFCIEKEMCKILQICKILHTCAVSDFQRCIDEFNMDLQRVHEWAAANGLKLNPIKRQVIVISNCRVEFPPPTLLIG